MGGINDVEFIRRDRLLGAVLGTGLVSLDLSNGASRVVVAQPIERFVMSRDGRFGVGAVGLRTERGRGPVLRFRLEDGTAQPLSTHGTEVTGFAMDASDSLVATGSADGTDPRRPGLR